MQLADDPGFVIDLMHVLFDDFLCSLKGVTFFFDKVIDQPDFLYVLFGKSSVAFLVFFRLDDVKFAFPITNKGGSYLEHSCHFPYGVIFLFDFFFLVWHSSKNWFIQN